MNINTHHVSPLPKAIHLRPLYHVIISLITALALACEADEPNRDGGADEVMSGETTSGQEMMNQPPQGEPGALNPLVIGLSIGQDALSFAKDTLITTAQLIEFASASAGQGEIITWGTITLVDDQANYQPTPTDRLILQYNENNITIITDQLQGSFTSAEGFLNADHRIRTQWYSEGLFNITVDSGREGQLTQSLIQGDLTLDQVTYQLNIGREERVTRNEVEYGSAARYSDEVLVGSVTSADLSIEVNESYSYKFVLFDNATESISRTANNTWTYMGDQYALQGVELTYETFDGWPNPSDFWSAGGTLLQNGQVIGQVTLDPQPLWIDVLLQLNDGTSHQIQRHLLRAMGAYE